MDRPSQKPIPKHSATVQPLIHSLPRNCPALYLFLLNDVNLLPSQPQHYRATRRRPTILEERETYCLSSGDQESQMIKDLLKYGTKWLSPSSVIYKSNNGVREKPRVGLLSWGNLLDALTRTSRGGPRTRLLTKRCTVSRTMRTFCVTLTK